MTTITVNVIRKFSGNYTYTIDDTGRITYPEKPQEPEKFRRVSRAKTPAQTSPAPAAKIIPARVQAAAAAAIPEPVQADPEPTPEPADYPKFKAADGDGVPGPKDRFSFVTLEGPIYNGFRLPLPEPGDKLYPVFMVVNQSGALMQTIREGTGEDLGWFLRSSGLEGGPEEAREKIINDIKSLRTWQRRTYAKSKEIPESITLPARGTLNFFQAPAADLYRALKDLGKKAYLLISGHCFPAHVIAAVCKLAGDELAVCTVDNKRGALVVELGKAKYTLKSFYYEFKNGARLIACSI